MVAFRLASEILQQYAEDAGVPNFAPNLNKFPLQIHIFGELLRERKKKVLEGIQKIETALVKIQDVAKEAVELHAKKDVGQSNIAAQSKIVDDLLEQVRVCMCYLRVCVFSLVPMHSNRGK